MASAVNCKLYYMNNVDTVNRKIGEYGRVVRNLSQLLVAEDIVCRNT